MANKRTYRTFEEARAYIRTLKLKGKEDYIMWAKNSDRPNDIPASPVRIYKEKWVTWGDWVGSGKASTQGRIYKSFKEARSFVRSLKLKGKDEYVVWAKSSDRPVDIPSAPARIYKTEWVSFGDWVGTGRVANQNKDFLSFIVVNKSTNSSIFLVVISVLIFFCAIINSLMGGELINFLKFAGWIFICFII